MAKRRTPEQIESAKLDLLRELYKKGVKLPSADLELLREKGLLIEELQGKQVSESEFEFYADAPLSKKEAEADSYFRIIESASLQYRQRLRKEQVRAILKKDYDFETKSFSTYTGIDREITREDWMPPSLQEHEPDFIRWIDSINSENGFFNTAPYQRFNMYVLQAKQWLQEAKDESLSEYEYQTIELGRRDQNSLYALNSDLELKEASRDGMKRYVATKAHEILLYILDCGYSAYIVKARQIAFTTTLAGWTINKASVTPDWIAKYISESEKKADATFDEKFKYPLERLPQWRIPDVKNDQIGKLVFGKKTGKAKSEGLGSSIEVVPPTKTAVASSTPSVTLVDEAGQIGLVQDIVSDTEPTLIGYSVKTQKQEILRQLIVWGTGGYMDGDGAAFKSIFMSVYEAWTKGVTGHVIPLFFNVWWRPGYNKEIYEKAKAKVYADTGPEAEKRRIRFHQGFPITLDDVFLQGGATLLDSAYIQRAIDRINTAQAKMATGYFEPIYDTNQPIPEGFEDPYKIVGAKFVPLAHGDAMATVTILDSPKPWSDRYYQGTDPIASDGGLSKMASVILDKWYMAPVCIVNIRTSNVYDSFRQVMLAGIYYDVQGKGAIPELIESNIGTAYRLYKEVHGLGKTIVYNTELPDPLQSRTQVVTFGLDNKGERNKRIINYLSQFLITYGDNIYLSIIFEQLKTFVCKQKGNSEVWEPSDKRYNRDDVLFGLVYSYICSLCFTKEPQEISAQGTHRLVTKRVMKRDANGQLYWHEERIKKQVLRRDYAVNAEIIPADR